MLACMIEVFRTDVQQAEEASRIKNLLDLHLPDCRIVFDLDDCDRILKITGGQVPVSEVMQLVQANGYCCEVLE